MEPNPTGLVSLEEEEIRTQTRGTQGGPYEDSGGRRPSASPGGRPQETLTLPTPSLWISSLSTVIVWVMKFFFCPVLLCILATSP